MKNLNKKDKSVSIHKKLKSEKFRILPCGNILSLFYKKCWTEIAQAYSVRPVNPNFINSSNRRYDTKIIEKLKNKSREIRPLIFSKENEKIYLQAKKWCTVPHTLKQRAKLMGFSLVNIDIENEEKDKDLWEIRLKNYKPNKGEINLSDSIDINNTSTNQLEKIKNFKRTAKRVMEKMNYDEDSEESWNTLIKWFTKEK